MKEYISRGVVKWFDNSKRFGVITRNDESDVVVYVSKSYGIREGVALIWLNCFAFPLRKSK